MCPDGVGPAYTLRLVFDSPGVKLRDAQDLPIFLLTEPRTPSEGAIDFGTVIPLGSDSRNALAVYGAARLAQATFEQITHRMVGRYANLGAGAVWIDWGNEHGPALQVATGRMAVTATENRARPIAHEFGHRAHLAAHGAPAHNVADCQAMRCDRPLSRMAVSTPRFAWHEDIAEYMEVLTSFDSYYRYVTWYRNLGKAGFPDRDDVEGAIAARLLRLSHSCAGSDVGIGKLDLIFDVVAAGRERIETWKDFDAAFRARLAKDAAFRAACPHPDTAPAAGAHPGSAAYPEDLVANDRSSAARARALADPGRACMPTPCPAATRGRGRSSRAACPRPSSSSPPRPGPSGTPDRPPASAACRRPA